VTITDDLHAWTMTALDRCTTPQRSIYMRVHGITTHGATNAESAADVARDLGITRQTAHDSLNAARLAVFQHIALQLVAREQQREDDAAMPVPGVTTLDRHEAHKTFVNYTTRTEYAIQLGEGSEAMQRIDGHRKQSPETNTLRIKAHQQYAKEQSA